MLDDVVRGDEIVVGGREPGAGPNVGPGGLGVDFGAGDSLVLDLPVVVRRIPDASEEKPDRLQPMSRPADVMNSVVPDRHMGVADDMDRPADREPRRCVAVVQ